MTYKEELENKIIQINNRITDLEVEKLRYKEMSDEIGDMSLLETISINIDDLIVEREEIKRLLSYA